jgi:DNA-binding transcriptional ArsR family regulator
MAYSKGNEFASDLQDISSYCKVLCHPARMMILLQLSKNKSSFCGELVNILPLAQSTVSQHLKELVKSDLVKATPIGVSMSYSVNKKVFNDNQKLMADMIEKILKNLKKDKNHKSKLEN